MSQTDHIKALAELERLAAQARKVKQLLGRPDVDPFDALEAINALMAQLSLIDPAKQQNLQEIGADMTARCVRARAEFWDSFRDACAKRSWSLIGTTDRRLIEQGIFLELSANAVRVDELSIDVHPSVDLVVKSLERHIDDIRAWLQQQDQFLDALERAYESAPGDRERSLEAVYRATFMHVQRPGFWKAVRPSQIINLTRPIFRACLAANIARGALTPTGRSLRFGTTLHGKEAWELFSPGEQRVVQVGRIALEGGSL